MKSAEGKRRSRELATAEEPSGHGKKPQSGSQDNRGERTGSQLFSIDGKLTSVLLSAAIAGDAPLSWRE